LLQMYLDHRIHVIMCSSTFHVPFIHISNCSPLMIEAEKKKGKQHTTITCAMCILALPYEEDKNPKTNVQKNLDLGSFELAFHNCHSHTIPSESACPPNPKVCVCAYVCACVYMCVYARVIVDIHINNNRGDIMSPDMSV